MRTLQTASSEECVKMARNCFEENFHNQIADLVHSYPIDHIKKDHIKKDTKMKFWLPPKRFP